MNQYIKYGMLCLVVTVVFSSCQDATTGYVEEEDVTKTASMTANTNHETQNVYISDENVLTYDHINAPTVSDWTTSVCKDDGSGSIGLNDPRWTRVEGQTASDIRHLLNNGLHAFETWWGGIHHPNNFGQAEWINSVDLRYSIEMNSEGEGHNWTRYDLPVDGNGTFELKLLADNCSWIYLDDQLVGYQDDAGLDNVDNIRYGVTLDGPATLSYIIYDGGGDAGGKFRLETTTEVIPEFEPPASDNQAPDADAGDDQTLEATGPTTSVTVDGSGSSDADGDELTYSWTLEGNEISTSVTADADLAPGSYTFTLTVSDGEDSDSDDVAVTVEDTTPPELSYDQVTGNLWPPNHKMVKVVTGIQATDLVDGSTDVTITVSSNEPANGKGDGNTEEDHEIQSMPDGSYTVYVRAERNGKNGGRVYTIDLSSSDNTGNTASASLEVSVAKSQGRR